MIKVKHLTIKNFLSVGQVPQTLSFDQADLTLILGENLDLGGDGARNGTGKTTMIQALNYALYGTAINQIKRDNLVNRTNSKNMVVTVDFSVGECDYRIVRGRKPGVLKFYVNNTEQVATDDSQGDSRETQDAIERVIGMSADMFKQIVALNTYSEPFLGMRVSDQRVIIEQLLGITLLSEKAALLKELQRSTKEHLAREEITIKSVEAANQKINSQISNLIRRQTEWISKRDTDIADMAAQYEKLNALDVEQELRAHAQVAQYDSNAEQLVRYKDAVKKQKAWKKQQQETLDALNKQYNALAVIDINAELQAHEQMLVYKQQHELEIQQKNRQQALQALIKAEEKTLFKLNSEVSKLQQHRCYACGQEIHDNGHLDLLHSKSTALEQSAATLEQHITELSELNNSPVSVPTKPITHYATVAEAYKHSSELEQIQTKIAAARDSADPYAVSVSELAIGDIGVRPTTYYSTQDEVIKHSNKVATLIKQIETRAAEADPYSDQIADMQQNALQTVDYSVMNDLAVQLRHQDYLLDLLTNKKSFVRKRIIDQNLGYLNGRLTHYLDKMGLPHQVVFQNDLSVEITEYGRETDFDALSRGERNRVIIGLSLAFRDVWENLYHPINVLFVDELIDNGMDTVGMENGLAILKDLVRNRQKSVWLISHRDELAGRVDSVLRVIKEGGFTTYSSDE